MDFKKYITLSYDDGVTQDIRFVELLNKYNMKATFNINSGLLGQAGTLTNHKGVKVSHNKIKKEDLKSIYSGHEVAVHTLTHPRLPELSKDEVIKQVEEDRLALESLNKSEVVGMAYPCGGVNYNEEVANIIKENTGVKYARTIVTTGSFSVPENLYILHPTAHHLEFEKLYKLADEFLALPPQEKSVFYIWGHSYEFDFDDTWGEFEEFLKYISNKKDVYYGTNKEVLDI
jgi:peptidoglycan/xylan/chitin deacetylase (PgdA/CDA1 family)